MVDDKKKSDLKRLTFALPEEDVELIESVRNRAMYKALGVSKSEVVRVALRVLDNMPDSFVIPVINGLEKRKQGRPKVSKKDD